MCPESPKLRAAFRAQITTDSTLIISEQSRWRGWLARHRGKDVTITIAPEVKPRSTRSNAYLWGVVYPALAEWSGHEPEEIHEIMKALFLPRQFRTLPDGSSIEVAGSTASLDTVTFGEYVDRLILFAAENGLYVPAPGEIVDVVA